MKPLRILALLFLVTMASFPLAQASCAYGTPSTQSTFELLIETLMDTELDDGDVACFRNMLSPGLNRDLAGNREGIELIRRYVLPFYDAAAISRRENAGRIDSLAHRHYQLNVYIIDRTRPSLGELAVIENDCWHSGEGGRRCRIMNIRALGAAVPAEE